MCLEKSTETEHSCAQEKLASLKTSWTEGDNIPGAFNWTTVQQRMTESTRAAVHARMALHLRTHAASALFRKTKGTSLSPCSVQSCEGLRHLTVPPPTNFGSEGPTNAAIFLGELWGRLFSSCVAPFPHTAAIVISCPWPNCAVLLG